MPAWLRWGLGLFLFAAIIGVPWIHYRATYAHSKRFREVTPDRFYRCGQLTADGFREVIDRYHIRTIINLQNEAKDPLIPQTYYDRQTKVHESALCESLGVKYVLLEPDLLPRNQIPENHPVVIDEYLKILEDPNAYPILIHCKAGLHRTGLLTAIYRMEYEGWSVGASVRELRANGFGDSNCNLANDYVVQYLSIYKRRNEGKKEGD